MQTTGIREEDILELDVRGHIFHALVDRPLHLDPMTKRRVVSLKPLRPGQSLLTLNVTSRQIRNHWRKRRKKEQ